MGHFPYIAAGETIEAEGDFTTHPVYGEQFRAVSFRTVAPEGTPAIEKYLASGAVKGIGPGLARRIVKKFKADTFRIIEEEPERLAEIKGISPNMAARIAEDAEKKRGTRDAIMFMQQYGITAVLANRIYERYGPALYTILKSNPYRLAEDIDGVGFRTADNIAVRMGMEPGDKYRIRCGILHCLSEAALDGHTWMSMETLKYKSCELLDLELGDIEPILIELQISGKVVMVDKDRSGDAEPPAELEAAVQQREPGDSIYTETVPDQRYEPQPGPGDSAADSSRHEDGIEVYFAAYYYTESNIAGMLHGLAIHGESDRQRTSRRISSIEKKIGMELDKKQREAVAEAVENGVIIITGGPGTGKTTTINALIRYFDEDHYSIVLAAPTGRAARRMSEATGCEAKTIHRLLEYTGMPSEGNAPGRPGSPEGTDGGIGAAPYAGSGNAGGAGATEGRGRFLRDEKNPLEADVVIIDEMSMVDIFLMNALLKAIVPGTRLIMVGDADQLPSVGAGNVLKDMIASGAFCTVTLSHIFRQAAMSDIVLNAHAINMGKPVDLAKKSRDFLFIRCFDAERTISSIEALITRKLPGYVNCRPLDIQVITATRKGRLGVEYLNKRLQEYLNPPAPDKAEKKNGEAIFRTGDKVMQIKNDYDLEWSRHDGDGLVSETGSGVFNGDIGRITEINSDRDTVTVMFDDLRSVTYDRKQVLNLELAYAVTVHKSQGSEYPAVVMPMFRGPRMLMNRNLLYTAVTRARQCIVLVGVPEAFFEMEHNENENRRCTGLKDRITEIV